MRNIRVVLFSIGFVDTSIALAKSISKDAEVILFGAHPDSPFWPDTRDELYSQLPKHIKVEKFFFPRIRNPNCVFLNREIVEKLLYYNPDIIHIQANGYPWFFLAAEFLGNYKIVNTVHDPQPHLGDASIKGNFLPPYFVKRFTDHFIVHGDSMKELLIQKYKISESEVSSIPLSNFSTYDRTGKKKSSEEENHVLFFGRIWKYKGLEYLIQAEPLISKYISDYKIVIAGKGEDFGKYQKLIKNKDNFIIKNYKLPESEISQLFQNASLLVLPYVEATQSGIIPMAYAFRKPVVVTNVGSLPEHVIHGETGLIVEAKSTREIAKSIIFLLKDSSLRCKMGIKSYEYGEAHLSDSAISEKILQTYRKVLG